MRVVRAGTAVNALEPAIFQTVSENREVAPTASTLAALPVAAPVAPSSGPVDTMAALDRFAVRGTTGGYLGSDDFLQFVRDAESGAASVGLFDGRGPLAILLIVLIGGLALNLTPCVLPMIPINLA
ncbi:MAG: hypothetical protein ABI024_03155, partial [Vicinamibacterales bacterium]